jgi:hypothetical protein
MLPPELMETQTDSSMYTEASWVVEDGQPGAHTA